MIPPETESQAERHFIELATRPLEGQPEIRDEARAELIGRLQVQSPEAREAALTQALGHLAKTIPAPWQRKAVALAALWLLLALITAWSGIQLGRQIKFNKDQEKAFSEWKDRDLSLDPQTFTKPAEYEALVDSGGPLPPDYREVWTRIDPDNGAWAWRDALDKAHPWSGKPHDYEIAWRLAEEAAQAPRFHRYALERKAAWWKPWGEPTNMPELSTRATDVLRPTPNVTQYLFRERIRIALDARDKESLRSTIRTWEQLFLKVAGGPAELAEASRLLGVGSLLKVSAEELGMNAETERITRQIEAMATPARDRHGEAPPQMAHITKILYYSGIFQWAPLTDLSTLEPARMAEYATADRYQALAAAVLLLPVLAGAIFESIRRGKRVNGLASGLAPLFSGADGLWLLGLGLLAPFAWHWGITRLTPCGWRDGSTSEFGYHAHTLQAVVGLLLMLVMTLQTAQWRLSRRAAFLGLGPRHLWIGWAVAGMTAALLPLAGLGRWLPTEQADSFVRIYLGGCGIPLLWLLWQGGAILFGSNANALGGVMLARAATLPLLLGIILLSALQPMMVATEKSWMAKDEVTGWNSSRGMTKQEARAIDTLAARCREAFADKPAAAPQR